MTYFRPIPQSDPARPPAALPLAGGPLWFDRLERLERGRAPAIVPAADAPPGLLDRLAAPRAPLAGLALDRPRLMGILNVTPDSFSDGGLRQDPALAAAMGRAMLAEGADLLDVGGESTRPGAREVPEAEELSRILPVIRALAGEALLSVDTRKAPVAEAALRAGAKIVNDVSGLRFDPALAHAARDADALVLTHSVGTPETMQDDPRYDDVLLDVYDALEAALASAGAAGVRRERVLLDVGLGFGKTLQHNVSLLRRLSLYHALGCPLLVGASRKGFVGTLGGERDARARAPGSIAAALHAAAQGAQVLRVHDMRETAQALRLWAALNGDGA